MNGLKRFLTVVFALAGLLALVALVLPWVGPYAGNNVGGVWLGFGWYRMLVGVLVCITAIGLLFVLIRALVVKNPKNILIENRDGGQITVSREAVASQAAHIIEADGSCIAKRVDARAKRGKVDVRARVLPRTSLDVVVKGELLHNQLVEGLAAICGDSVGKVSLEFMEPQSITDTQAASYTADGVLLEAAGVEDAVENTSEITVPISGHELVLNEDTSEATEIDEEA